MLLKKTSRGTQRVLFGHRDRTKLWAESNLVFCGFKFSWTGNFVTDEKTSVFGKVTASCCESRLAVRDAGFAGWDQILENTEQNNAHLVVEFIERLLYREMSSSKTFAMLCLVYHISVVTLSLPLNRLSAGRLVHFPF